MEKTFSNQDGFTLIELLTVLAILSVILGSIFMFYSSGLKFWVRGSQATEIQQHGRIAMNRMIKELRQAKEITIPNGSADEIVFTTLSGEQVRFYLSGTQLLRSGGNNPLANYIQTIGFSYLNEGKTVKIEMSLKNGEQSFSLRSAVAPRNLLDA